MSFSSDNYVAGILAHQGDSTIPEMRRRADANEGNEENFHAPVSGLK
jgi:hypothetical protein